MEIIQKEYLHIGEYLFAFTPLFFYFYNLYLFLKLIFIINLGMKCQ